MLTEDQKHIRTGKFTGSEIYKIMGAKGMGKTGETYVFEKVSEFLTGLPANPEFKSAATDWGNEHESEAADYLCLATGIKIKELGTIHNDDICCTPDRIEENDRFGIEIKCPYNISNHLKNLCLEKPVDLLELHPEYYWQIVTYSWLTKIEHWKFVSYDPRFKEEKRMFVLNFMVTEKEITPLKNRIIEANLMFNNIISKL